MPRRFPVTLKRIRLLAAQRNVRFTLKAQQELAGLGWGFDAEDACQMLTSLTSRDFAGRLVSKITGEWMYVFKPSVSGVVLYVKLVLRNSCLVVSFHEDTGEEHEEDF
jgi:hypothetical protein